MVNGVYLGNGNSMQGLPNFVNSYFGGFWQPPCNVGIEENIISDGIIIYPNPFSSSATIRIYEELRTKNAELRVYDILGREFLNMKLETENTKLERGNLSSGIYFLKVQVKNKIFTQKLIIANH
ncbi:MAG: T9SS type A sorting domain-containing protein [candidate division NC10 bacterium]|nr:T9SS type A sorting domain-containing protein [candidate division NC10 bacterium]